MVRVLVNGAKGRMGQEVVKAVTADTELELCAECDIGDDLAVEIKRSRADVVVDFTTAQSGVLNTEIILGAGARPVIGTSGFKQAEVTRLQTLARQKRLGGVIAPNFAIGAVLMMKFAAEAAKYFPDAEILELHHQGKADSPSGTSIRTAEMIASARRETREPRDEVAIIPGARGAELNGVRIHSSRLPGYVAKQQVLFGAPGQTLTITHDSSHRESFMPGVCHACRTVVAASELHYGLENLL